MDLTAYLDQCRNWVRDELKTMLPSDSSRTGGLYKLMLNYPLRYGKALRPALSIAVCRARGGSLSAVLPTAAVLELYHNAFLVHDDVEDQSTMRRSEPTLYRQYGLPIAVKGDGMLAVAIQPLLDNIERVGLGKALKILRIVSRMARETAEGQMIELDWVRSANWGHDDVDYTRLVHKKSGWYSFIAPIMVGAVAADLSDTEVARLGRIAIPLGIAFQIQDDILNLSANSETYGKDSCGDLWEGKHTLILIHALRSATPSDRSEALTILRKPQSATMRHAGDTMHEVEPKSQADINFLRGVIEHSGSIPYALASARNYAGRFKRDLDRVCKTWSHSKHRDFLQDLAEFTINRSA
jgi:geranylgeranyl diphosphate synthase type II